MTTCAAAPPTAAARSSRRVLGDRTIERTNSDEKLVGLNPKIKPSTTTRKSKKPISSGTSKKSSSSIRKVQDIKVKSVAVKKRNKDSASDDSSATFSILSFSSSEFETALVKSSSSKKKKSSSKLKKSSSKSSSSKKRSKEKADASKDDDVSTKKPLFFNNRCNDLTKNTAEVFHLHLNRPAIVIQAAVRGMLQRLHYQTIQREELQFQEMIHRHEAAMEIQDAVRAWLSKMKRQVATLSSRFAAIHVRYQKELGEIEDHKQRFMQSVYKEMVQERQAQDEQQDVEHTENFALLRQLKKDNKQLRKENKTLRKANGMMANKNQKAAHDLAQVEVNIEHMKNVIIPRLESDSRRGEQVCAEWVQSVQQYKDAIAEYDGKFRLEKTIRQVVQNTIQEMADHVDEEEDYEQDVRDAVHDLVDAL
jgi:IQ calmodulin-binding motif